MPKIKTSKSASKRIIKITSQGQLVRLTMSAQHLARRKSKRARQNAINQHAVHKSVRKRILRVIPYR